MILSSQLAHYIKNKIKDRCHSLDSFSSVASISRTTLTSQLNRSRPISLDQLSKICNELNMSVLIIDNSNQRTFKIDLSQNT